MVTCGYPADGTSYENDNISVSKGEVLSSWKYEPENLDVVCDPTQDVDFEIPEEFNFEQVEDNFIEIQN